VQLDKDVTIAVDSSGIKVSNREEWIHKKWRVQRGFIKVHIAVDVKTKQILAIEVTKEDVGDGRVFGKLVRGSAGVANVKKVIGDGAYDSKANFSLASEMKVEPLIRCVRTLQVKLMVVCLVSLLFWSSLAIQGGDVRRVMVIVGWLNQRSHA
jgi:hypothetical protein